MPVLNIDGSKIALQERQEPDGTHTIKINDQTFKLEILQENLEERFLLVKTEGRVSTVKVGDSRDGVWFPVQLNGRTLKARIEREEVATHRREKTAREEAPVMISSPMAGKIVALKASMGSKVEEGQALVVLEAMKMENEIAAPRTGEVKEVFVQQGSLVKPGDKLVLIE